MTQLLFHNFSGRDKPDYSKKICDSMLVEDGKIALVDFGIETFRSYQNAARIDLGGAVVLPAFTDSHVHFMQTGIQMLGLHCDAVSSIRELLEILNENAKSCADECLLIWDFDETRLQENRTLTLKELDRAVPDKRLWMSRIDLHSASANTPAIEWLRNYYEDLVPDDSTFSGENYIRAAGLITSGLPRSMKLKALSKASARCLEKGISTVHALEGSETGGNDDVQLTADYLKKMPLNGIIFHQSFDPALAIKNGWPRLGGCILMDGSLGSRTAALNEPYTDDPSTTGKIYSSATEFEILLKTCFLNNMQNAIHTIGDRAIDIAVSLHKWLKETHGALKLPNRLEHFILPTDKAIMGARECGLTVCVQPTFDYYWGGDNGMYCRRLGEKRAKRTNPFKTLLDLGIPLIAGSDSPVTPIDPFLGIHAFVNHSNPDEAIDLNSALAAFISEPHFSTGEGDFRGRLKPGYSADFICTKKDPFLSAPSSLKDIEIDSTYIAGKKVAENSHQEIHQ